MSETKTTTYVEYLFAGSFVADTSVREIEHQDVTLAAAQAPDGAYGFRFFTKVHITASVDGQEVATSSKRRGETGVFYLDAELLNAARVAALPGNHTILLDNMRMNHWDHVVHCRAGGWFQPFREGDQIVSAA